VVPKPGVEVGAKLPIPIRTSRLLLRRLIPMDSNDLLEIVSDEDVLLYQDWYPMDEQEVQSWLEDDQKRQLFQQGFAGSFSKALMRALPQSRDSEPNSRKGLALQKFVGQHACRVMIACLTLLMGNC
jgi:hypothetical protein